MAPDSGAPSDRFVAEDRIGRGGMGDIYRGVDQETGATVAIKLLRTSATAQERARFRREIAILADLRHPNIVQYVAHGTWHDGRLYFAMEWLDGEDLAQRQRRAPLGMKEAVEVVRRSAAAMAAIHARGVIHRDLKLSNIFLLNGRGTIVKLIDFGVVKPAEPDEHDTERGQIIGTPHFMAPEQARGEAIDARADVYSLGSVLFRLITGRNVFETEHIIALLGRLVLEDPPTASSFRLDVPEALDQVITRAIARSPDVRYDNGAELARALARVGPIPNDPPAAERSTSNVRLSLPRRLLEAELMPAPARPGTSERRVVAVLLYDLGGAKVPRNIDVEVRELLGADTRFEALAGGRVVAVLGATRSVGDEALRAARAALTVARAIPSAKVTVAVGHAVRGRDNLAGEALDRAAAQLVLAMPGGVRVDTAAAAALAGRFVVHEDQHGGLLIREDPDGFGARLLLGRPTPTVGRDKEIALLEGIYAELCEDGAPRAAVVTGPAGVGKSRVRAELLAHLEGGGSGARTLEKPELLICRGDPMSRGSSLSALGRALRASMAIRDGEAPAEQIAKVKAHVATHLPRSTRFLAAFLGELVSVPFPTEADAPDEQLRAARASAQLMASRLRMMLEAFVRASKVPIVLVIEDLHWADDTTIELVDWLLGCPDLEFGVFAFARPELLTRLPHLWERRTLTRLALSPLSQSAAERLVRAALPSAEAALVSELVSRAGGNALFLEELARAAAEGRDELPFTVQAVVQLRLDRMSPRVREVLRAGAIFGQSFWTGGVEALLDRGAGAELAELTAAELVTKQGASRIAEQDEWTFRQALVRDVVYASILDEDRALLHLAAGAWLESAGDADAGLIAKHADAGGDLTRAAAFYARATRQAITHGSQLETALALAERGLHCGDAGAARAQAAAEPAPPAAYPRAELLLARAQVLAFMGRIADAAATADEAASLSQPGSDAWGEAQRILAGALIESGRSADGDARAAWALDPAFGLSEPIRATLLATRVRGLLDLRRLDDALEVADAAVQAAYASGSLDPILRALDARLFALAHANDLSEAIAAGLTLTRAADEAGDVVAATRGRINTGSALNHVGMFEEAGALLEHALIDARGRRMRVLEAFALHNAGMSWARLGQLDLAIAHQRQAAPIAEECNVARLRVVLRVYEAVFLTWRGAAGDLDAAREQAERAHQEALQQPSLQVCTAFVLARVQLERRAFDEALARALEAVTLLQSGPVEEWDEYIRLTLIEALHATGRSAEADASTEQAFRAVEAHAAAIRLPLHRQAFLTRNGEVRRLVELAETRLGLQLPSFAEGSG